MRMYKCPTCGEEAPSIYAHSPARCYKAQLAAKDERIATLEDTQAGCVRMLGRQAAEIYKASAIIEAAAECPCSEFAPSSRTDCHENADRGGVRPWCVPCRARAFLAATEQDGIDCPKCGKRHGKYYCPIMSTEPEKGERT